MSELAERLRATQHWELVYAGGAYSEYREMQRCTPDIGEWLDVDDIPLAALADVVEAAEDVRERAEQGNPTPSVVALCEALDALKKAMEE